MLPDAIVRPIAATLAAAALYALASESRAQTVAATIEAYSGSVRITTSTGARRAVAVGASVYGGDTIRTGAASSVRLRLVDGTIQTIGSNQRVTLQAPAPAPAPTPSPSGLPSYDEEMRIFVATINAYRARAGLVPLQVSVALSKASAWMSQDMVANNRFSHTDSLGRDPFVRMSAFTYDYATWRGENIAAGYAAACSTFNQWKNSSGHNANMLNANYRVIGVGRAYGPNATYRWYWTTDFGGAVDNTMAVPAPQPNPNLSADGACPF